MYQDLPFEIVERRRAQMETFKKARRNNIPAAFSKAQSDKLYIKRKIMAFWNAVRSASLITQVLNTTFNFLVFCFNKVCPLFLLKIFVFSQNYDRWTGTVNTPLLENISFLKLCLLFRLWKLSKLYFHTNAALSQ